MNFMVNVGRAILGAALFVLFFVLGIGFLASLLWLPAVIFLVVAVGIFVMLFLPNVCCIRLNNSQVERQLFCCITTKHFEWNEIDEVGVVGLRIFGFNKKRVGAKYIYFSPQKMKEEERFQMCLKWPPHDILYMRYSPERLSAVKNYWKSNLSQYNIGDLTL